MVVTSVPSKRMDPAEGSISRSARRAVVDFPHPLSPTRARVSPRSTWKETPSTARTVPVCRAMIIPLRTG